MGHDADGDPSGIGQAIMEIGHGAPAGEQRLRESDIDVEVQALGVREDPKTGDVLFDAVAVDKNKTPNRRGFVFDWQSPDDVHVDAWMLNPVLLYLHDSDKIPVGWMERIAVGAKAVNVTGRILDLSKDPDLAEYDKQVLAPVRGAVRKGLLKAVSIGFYVRKFVEEQMDEKSLTPGRPYIRVLVFEIVELSICPVGAHETALIKQSNATREKFAAMLGAGKLVASAEGPQIFTLSLPSAGVRESPTGPLQTTSADVPHPPHEAAIVPPETSPGLSEAAKKELAAFTDLSWRGIARLMGAVLGARGQMKNVPESVRHELYKHVAAVYERFCMDPPGWRPYTAAELTALHRQWRIYVPGVVDVDGEHPAADEPDAESGADDGATAEALARTREAIANGTGGYFMVNGFPLETEPYEERIAALERRVLLLELVPSNEAPDASAPSGSASGGASAPAPGLAQTQPPDAETMAQYMREAAKLALTSPEMHVALKGLVQSTLNEVRRNGRNRS